MQISVTNYAQLKALLQLFVSPTAILHVSSSGTIPNLLAVVVIMPQQSFLISGLLQVNGVGAVVLSMPTAQFLLDFPAAISVASITP